MENKTGKYLKYAIGEIVLVVIGILIALQINTWNENKKKTVLEIKHLKELKSDIVETLKDVNKDVKYQNKNMAMNGHKNNKFEDKHTSKAHRTSTPERHTLPQ